MHYLWKIGGEAGFGIMTTGMLFSIFSSRSGYHIYDYTEYPSLIRGGHNTTDVVFSPEPVYANKHQIDMLVCLNKETYELHKHRLHENSIIIYDEHDFTPDGPGKGVNIPFRKIKRENKVMQIMVNTVALGASLALLDADLDLYYSMLEEMFGKKGEEVVQFNRKMADIGVNHVREHYKDLIQPVLARREAEPKLVMTGNDAFAFATVAADCRMYCAYPMTPSSTVLATLADWERKSGIIVRHAEDEISVIITALGASAAGARTAVGTSGGGFALMVEAVSYAGIAEVPIVIFMSQRPGPATGMPTWTEQGDLLFTVNAGHGEFPKIVLTPGDVKEMIDLTLEAFNLADIYQTPVIVMSDKLLSESHLSYSKKEIMDEVHSYEVNRGKMVFETHQEPYLRYKVTDDGISERLVPGQKGKFFQYNSYEHHENGHTSELAEDRIAQVDKRNRKIQKYLQTEFKPPAVFGDLEASEFVFVSWGGNKGVILEAQRLLQEQGVPTAYIHFTHVYPMDEAKVLPLFQHDKYLILVENNNHAQFGQLLRQQTGVNILDKMLRYDGRPFTAEEIAKGVHERKGGK